MKKVIFLALFIFSVACVASMAEVSAEASAGDTATSFFLSIGDYFSVSPTDVAVVRQRGIPDEEIPAVFFLARQAKKAPLTITELRLKGQSWLEITKTYGFGPEIFYVPVEPNEEVGPPYGYAYGYYKDKPRREWNNMALEDSDIINLVNLKFMSEHFKYPPKDIMKMRHEEMKFYAINDEIVKQQLDKYVGDTIMAFWNAPQDVSDHAVKACLAALGCRDRLLELQKKWKAKGLVPIDARIGINTGDVIVGNIGSLSRLNYTCIGDSVNLASRLEGACKVYSVPMIISEHTWRMAKDHIAARRIDCVAVKGKTRGVGIYELISTKENCSQKTARFISDYEEAFNMYLERRWEDAINKFETLSQAYDEAGDPVSLLLIDRCRFYIVSPPPESWDGIFRLEQK
jgi:class 3 adenylate cyclase